MPLDPCKTVSYTARGEVDLADEESVSEFEVLTWGETGNQTEGVENNQGCCAYAKKVLSSGDWGNQTEGVEKKQGCCAYVKRHNYTCLLLCFSSILAAVLTTYFLWLRTIELCYEFDFGAEVLLRKEGDEDIYEMKLVNNNYYKLALKDLDVKAYYGGREDNNEILGLFIDEWGVDSRESSTRDVTFVYMNNFTDVVSATMLWYCRSELIDSIEFELSVTFTGCMLNFCRDVVNNDLVFTKYCWIEGDWTCLDYQTRL